MAFAVTMPQLGESVVEGTVTRWLKMPGESIDKMEPLVEIATDKIDTEVPAPASGVVLSQLVGEGTTVAAGTVLAYIGEMGEEIGGEPETKTNDLSVAQDLRRDTVTSRSDVPAPSPATLSRESRARIASRGGRGFISPIVARMAAEQNVDLDRVAGTGLGGRITKRDLLAYVGQADRSSTPPLSPSPDSLVEVDADERSSGSHPQAYPQEILHPLTTMRRAIANHMVSSKRTSPHVTTVVEADMTGIVRHREANKCNLMEKGAPLTFFSYFVAATAVALKGVPILNSRFTDDGIVEHRDVHIGIAVAIRNGLVVPVIRNADEKNLQGLARAIADLAKRARTNQLLPDELVGGTFTVTNHGTGGSLVATPIINQPQAGIMGVGAIVKRPVVRSVTPSLLPSADDAIVIRPMCYLSLTFDHRVADGAQADEFLRVIKDTLENWQRA